MQRMLLTLAMFAMLSGCTSPDSDSDTTTETSTVTASTTATSDPGTGPQTHHVAIEGFAFAPADLEIAVGDTVVWTNKDGATHTVDSTDGGPLDSGNLGRDQTFSFTFTEAGSFAYQCDIHPSMQGTVTVS